MTAVKVTRVRIPELRLTVVLPDMPDAEADALNGALQGRSLDDRVEIISAVQDLYRLQPPGPIQ